MKNILVIDDDSQLRKKITQYLTLEGFIVSEVKDGSRALKILENKLPDLILSDVEMPGMNGYELLKFKFSKPELMSIPVILMSGKNYKDGSVDAKTLGADGFLQKPFRLLDLLRIINKVFHSQNNKTYEEIQKWVLKKYYTE